VVTLTASRLAHFSQVKIMATTAKTRAELLKEVDFYLGVFMPKDNQVQKIEEKIVVMPRRRPDEKVEDIWGLEDVVLEDPFSKIPEMIEQQRIRNMQVMTFSKDLRDNRNERPDFSVKKTYGVHDCTLTNYKYQ